MARYLERLAAPSYDPPMSLVTLSLAGCGAEQEKPRERGWEVIWAERFAGPHAAGGAETPDENGETRQEAETRRAIAEANLKELRAGQLAGQLIDVDDVCREAVHCFTHARALLEQVPHRLLALLPAESTGDDKRQFITEAQTSIDGVIEVLYQWCDERQAVSTPEGKEDGESDTGVGRQDAEAAREPRAGSVAEGDGGGLGAEAEAKGETTR